MTHGLRPLSRFELLQRLDRYRDALENSFDDDPVFYDPLKLADDHPAAADLFQLAHYDQPIARQHRFAKSHFFQPAKTDHRGAQKIVSLRDEAAKLGDRFEHNHARHQRQIGHVSADPE